MSGVRCPVSGVRCPVSGIRCLQSGVCSLLSGAAPIGKTPRELCLGAALSGLFPTFRGDSCEPTRSASRGALAVASSRPVEPKFARSGLALPAPAGTEAPAGCPPRGAGRFDRCRPSRGPENGPRCGAEAPSRRWPGVSPVSNRFPGEPSGPTTAPSPVEAEAPPGADPALRPSRLARRGRSPFEPGDRLATASGAFRPAEAGPSAPSAEAEAPAEGAESYDDGEPESNQIAS